MTTRMIAENLVTGQGADVRLVGGRNRHTGAVTFPCPGGAEAALYEPIALSPRGKLWSWTVQRFLPKSPPYAGPETLETFRPFAIGYVELEGQCIVESRLVDVAFDALQIGMEMEVTLAPFTTDAQGNRVQMFAFKPVA